MTGRLPSFMCGKFMTIKMSSVHVMALAWRHLVARAVTTLLSVLKKHACAKSTYVRSTSGGVTD